MNTVSILTYIMMSFFISKDISCMPMDSKINTLLIDKTRDERIINNDILKYSDEDVPFMLDRLRGTDKWDDLIIKVSKEEGIDSAFTKVIMSIESAGELKSINYNTNNSYDSGLLQVNSGFGKQFDYKRMLVDPEYSIRSGVKVIKGKIIYAKQLGMKPNAYNILWLYNGKSAKGKRYADKMIQIYSIFRNKDFNIEITNT